MQRPNTTAIKTTANILLLLENADKILMCKRKKDPYKGLANFVGGKIEKNENGLDAAYRELEEETTITKDDIMLLHIILKHLKASYYNFKIK